MTSGRHVPDNTRAPHRSSSALGEDSASVNPSTGLAYGSTLAPSPFEAPPTPTHVTPPAPSTTDDETPDDEPPDNKTLEDTLLRAPEATWLGHYRLLDELGRGGMGVVYSAHDTKLDRKVAIKQLKGGGSDHQRRLIREALAMAKLSHPNVIPIYEIGERGDSAFIVMEFIDGETLREWQAASRTPAELLTAYKAAARGLIAAHQKKLVHRDFKPANVMVGADGRVRVMDFGLASVSSARIEDGAPDDFEPSERSVFDPLTQTGSILGTPAYMSPEQLRAEPATASSDQFSYCVALYEGLYGERPFGGKTIGQLSLAMDNREIREAPSDTEVPDWLRELVCHGLAVRAEERFESMQALLDVLVEGEIAHDADRHEPPEYVFVAHDNRDKQAVLRLCEGLLDLGVRPWLDMWELTPGEDWREPVEAALANAPAVLVCGGSERELGQALADRVARDPATVYRAGLPGAGSPTLAEFEGVELDEASWDDGVLALARLVGIDHERASWLEREAERAGIERAELSPYRGLEAFREQDARWMFGREEEVGALLELIRADQTRFLTLIGASGSGKSSLLMGGVCPALRNGVLGDGRDWSIAYLRPGPRPCEALAHAIVNLQATGDAVEDALKVKRLRAELLDGDDTLRLVLSRRDKGRVLLVIDQLEELFTEAGLGGEDESPEALAFVRNLRTATQELMGVNGRLWITATLRADFMQRGLEVRELALALKAGTYSALPPMSEGQIRAAIERPAARVGYRIESKLVDELVAAAAHQAGRLPLLQHVLRELWARRDGERRVLTHAIYAETGGLEGAIAVAAERALNGLRHQLGEPAESVTRRLMTRLVHLGNRTSEDTRRRVGLEALGADATMRRVLEAFVGEARVLVAAEVDEVETVEIAHEALLREWKTLVEWLDADRDALKLRQELARDAGKRESASTGEYLWGRGRVEEARRVLGASVVELNEAEQKFLETSERAVRRQRRWIRGAVAAALAVAAGVVTVVSGKNSELDRQNVALNEKDDEISQQKTAVEEKNRDLRRKQRAQRESLSVQRGLRAQMLIAEDRESEALLLGVQAVGTYGPDWTLVPPKEATDALGRVLVNSGIIIDDNITLGEGGALTYSPNGSRVATTDRGTVKIWDPSTGELITALEDHGTRIGMIAYSPDGSRLATRSTDMNTARIWDAATGEVIATLQGRHIHNWVYVLAYSPDGTHITTASWDNTARVWSPSTGRLVATLKGHEDVVTTLVYSPDGSRIATASWDNTVREWDPSAGQLLATFKCRNNGVRALAYSPDGSHIATVSNDNTTEIWSSLSGKITPSLKNHERRVVTLVYSPDGSQVATTNTDGTAKIWDPSDGKLLITLRNGENTLSAVTYSPDGSQIATASSDETVKVWDPATGNLLATLRGHSSRVGTVTYSPDGTHIAATSYKDPARIWPLSTDSVITTLKAHSGEVVAVACSPDGRHITTASKDGTARVWDPSTGSALTTLEGHEDIVAAVAYSPNGSRVATASFDDTARVWSPTTGEAHLILEGHEDAVYALAYSPDGSRIATASFDDTARVWDSATGELLVVLEGHEDVLVAVVYSHDGSRITTASTDNTAREWDSSTGKLLATLEAHESFVAAVAYSPDGSRIATASFDGTAKIWDPETGDRTSLLGHGGAVAAVAYSPDGSRIATASSGNTAMLWDTSTGEFLVALGGHEDDVRAVVYSHDGSRIATASSDGTAKVWDSSTGELLATFTGHQSEVNEVIFSPDDTRIFTASDDQSAKVWDSFTGEILADLKDRVGLRQPDGSIEWPVPPRDLTRIGCQRLQPFEADYAQASDICDPLLAD